MHKLSKAWQPESSVWKPSAEMETYTRVSCLRRGKLGTISPGRSQWLILATRRVDAERSADGNLPLLPSALRSAPTLLVAKISHCDLPAEIVPSSPLLKQLTLLYVSITEANAPKSRRANTEAARSTNLGHA